MRTIFLATWLLPAVALAGGYAIPNENARELALGQATVAAQTGPEAVYQNPAALAGQEGLALSVSGQLLYNMTSWSDPSLGSASIDSKPSFPPSLAVGYGAELENGMAYGIGAGFSVIGGGGMDWGPDWKGNTRIETVSQQVYLAELGAGFRPVSWLKLGASVLYYRVTEKLTQQVNFISNPAEAELGLSGGAVSFGAGAEITPADLPLTFGIDYRHQGAMTLEGDAHFEGVPPMYAPAGLIDQGVTGDLTVPSELFVGAAWRATPQLQVMAAWSWENWSVYKDDTFVGDKGFSVSVPRDFRNAWVYRLGVEYTKPSFLPALTLRAGLDRSISNQPTDTVSPTLPDTSSWGFAAGAGYDLTSDLRADIGYQFGYFDDITASGTEALPGTYKTRVHLLSLGIAWRFEQPQT